MSNTRLDIAPTEDPLVCRKEESVQTGYARAWDMCRGEGTRMDRRGGGNGSEMGYEEEQNWDSATKQVVEQEELERWLHELMCCGALELTVQRSVTRDVLRNWRDSVPGWCRAQAGGCEAITGQREGTDSGKVVDMRACMELDRNALWLRLRRSDEKQEEQKEEQKEQTEGGKKEVSWVERGREWLRQNNKNENKNSTYRDSSAGKRCADGTVRQLGWLQEQEQKQRNRTETGTETGTEKKEGKKRGGSAPAAQHRTGSDCVCAFGAQRWCGSTGSSQAVDNSNRSLREGGSPSLGFMHTARGTKTLAL